METKYYIIIRIDGDYAWLQRTDTDKQEEPVFITPPFWLHIAIVFAIIILHIPKYLLAQLIDLIDI